MKRKGMATKPPYNLMKNLGLSNLFNFQERKVGKLLIERDFNESGYIRQVLYAIDPVQ
jgi:hypothetical protein